MTMTMTPKRIRQTVSLKRRLIPFFVLTHGVAWLFFFAATLAGGLETEAAALLFSSL